MRRSTAALFPALATAALFLAAVIVKKLTGLDWSNPLPAALAASAPLAGVLVMIATRTVPYSRGPLLASGILLASGLFAAISLFGQRGQVVMLLMNSVLLFSMLGVLPQRRAGWCYTDRGLVLGSFFMAVTFVATAALLA